ncbi:HET-domain-containing protein [Dothidotthia symphoricarpi CBS 119687]|uniref:HET-domain-containing protein n=1 Tax=Dothidotthia symphoricarpi CBS 119687 TaxID=1392245 RepID=A0A6A6AG01_9PLEO|nr:HET-domain-containing protein [Dothidotthia symphoricarpi CBS 119687]KAF2130045.1 HET-domain-containing protein [Dothidotthia symphoricarpi CBS 119687]
MFCDICVGVLQYRRNPIPRNKSHDDELDDDGSTKDGEETENEVEMTSEDKVEDQEAVEDEDIAQGQERTEDEQQQAEEDEWTEEEESSGDEEKGSESSSRDDCFTGSLAFGHQRSSSALIKSAKAGCYICKTVWDSLPKSVQGNVCAVESEFATNKEQELDGAKRDPSNSSVFFTHAYLWALARKPPGSLYLRIVLPPQIFENHHDTTSDFRLTPAPVTKQGAEESSLVDVTSTHTFSNESIRTATRWMNVCLKTHSACNRDTSDVPWLPTRLLDLGDSGEHDEIVRLIHTAEERPVEELIYLTLSHRWGAAQFIQLTRFNMAQFLNAITVADMPRTFREAVFVSRTLGISYLWIDSLCIIQDKDDLSDWFREAELMHKVYSHSYCNISASDAEDSTEGLFRNRTIRVAKAKVYMRDFHRAANCTDVAELTTFSRKFWDRNVTHCGINQRGWVFQERILSPRILHFGKELFWECRQHSASETYPRGLSDYFDKNPSSRFKIDNDICMRTTLPHALNNKHEWYAKWHSLVETYSATHFTNPNDKLIVLSGIAKQFAALTNDIYVAGLWHAVLELELLWMTPTKTKHSDDVFKWARPVLYRAPTWSWASIEGPVLLYQWVPKQILFEVQDVVLEHATKDVTGRVKNGWLDLRGYLKPMKVTRDATRTRDLHVPWVSTSPEFTLTFDVTPADESILENESEKDKFFFILGAVGVPVEGYTYVLLLRIVDVAKGEYERVGVGSGFLSPEELSFVVSELGEETKKKVPCLRYDNGQHTIRVI